MLRFGMRSLAQGLAVDEEGFRRLMREQRERAKADAAAKRRGHADVSAYREVLALRATRCQSG